MGAMTRSRRLDTEAAASWSVADHGATSISGAAWKARLGNMPVPARLVGFHFLDS